MGGWRRNRAESCDGGEMVATRCQAVVRTTELYSSRRHLSACNYTYNLNSWPCCAWMGLRRGAGWAEGRPKGNPEVRVNNGKEGGRGLGRVLHVG